MEPCTATSHHCIGAPPLLNWNPMRTVPLLVPTTSMIGFCSVGAPVQAPLKHTVSCAQTVLHVPQVARSLDRFRHRPEQFVRPGPQIVAHVPPWHVWPKAHTVWHVP